jgi:hypothetical protein
MTGKHNKRARVNWTEKSIQTLIFCTQKQESAESIANLLGCHVRTVQKKQTQLGLRSNQAHRIWAQAELEQLRHLYANTDNKLLAKQFQCSPICLQHIAHRLGLHKSHELLSVLSKEKLIKFGSQHTFQPGHVPYNKGIRHPGYAVGHMAETQFKKGQCSPNWLPIGSIRYSKDGYQERKAYDTGYPPHNWVGEHILLWEKHHGPVPPSHAVCFKDGNKTNITIDNLELVSRADLMRRNAIHNLPKELVDVIMLNGALKRRVRELNEKQA